MHWLQTQQLRLQQQLLLVGCTTPWLALTRKRLWQQQQHLLQQLRLQRQQQQCPRPGALAHCRRRPAQAMAVRARRALPACSATACHWPPVRRTAAHLPPAALAAAAAVRLLMRMQQHQQLVKLKLRQVLVNQ
jgi:hypothetical protein